MLENNEDFKEPAGEVNKTCVQGTKKDRYYKVDDDKGDGELIGVALITVVDFNKSVGPVRYLVEFVKCY